MRQHLAWKSILAERRELNLHAYSETQAKTKTEESDSTVDHRIRETYTWLLVPGQQEPTAEVTCTAVRVQGQGLLAELPHPRLQDLRVREGVAPALARASHQDLSLARFREDFEVGGVGTHRASLADRIEAAFIFGSIAKRTDRASSDIDLLVISADLAYPEVYEALQPAERDLARSVNPTVMTPAQWRDKRARHDSFVARIADQPRLFVLGNEDALS